MTRLGGEQIEAIGFSRIGDNVVIEENALFYGAEHIAIGSDVRIDAFAVITAGPETVEIGNHVHIACGVMIFGTQGVRIEDFCGLAPRATVFTTNDDYTGGALTGPTVPEEYRNVETGTVVLRKHAIIGCGSVVMPGVEVGVGASVGALSFVNKNILDFVVVSGRPLQCVGTRSRSLLDREREFLER